MKIFKSLIIPIKIIILFFIISCKERNSLHLADDKIAKVIKTARSYIGTPYQYGGTTSKGIDCSGLLRHSFNKVDVSIPRTSKEQSKIGVRVKLKNIQRGDMVFFAFKRGKKITHVGLVTSISKKKITFIHSSTQKGVIEENLLAPHYLKKLVLIRRIL